MRTYDSSGSRAASSPSTAASPAPTRAVATAANPRAASSQAPAQPGATMAALHGLVRVGTVVREMAEALGTPPDRLASAEALERIELDTALSVAALDDLSPSTVAGWFAVFGDDLHLDLRLSDDGARQSGMASLLRAGRSPDATFADFVAAVALAARTASDDLRIEVRLALSKSRAVALVRDLLTGRGAAELSPSQPDATRVTVFYTSAAWHPLLAFGAIADWERLGIVRDDARTVVVLCDSAGYLAGPALEILGARVAEEPPWLAVSPAAWRRFRDRAGEVREMRDTEGNWPNAPRVLTPAHLRVESRSPGLETSVERLAEMRAALAAAYLASAVQSVPGASASLRFAGPRPATCALPSVARHHANGGSPAAVPSDALAQLAGWAYAHASPDKLAIARECLSRELAAGREVALVELAAAAGGALEAAKANFVLYLRGNTEQYFRLRQQALDAVAAYTASVRKSVGDLTGDVVGDVYRTVGLLAGVVIAALIQPSLSPLVTKIAAALYTLYMVFVLTYLLSARERRFQLESADLDARLTAMPELSASERVRLRAQADPERAYFERYFRLSRAIYIALAALGLLLFFLLLWTPLGTHLAASPAATPAR